MPIHPLQFDGAIPRSTAECTLTIRECSRTVPWLALGSMFLVLGGILTCSDALSAMFDVFGVCLLRLLCASWASWASGFADF